MSGGLSLFNFEKLLAVLYGLTVFYQYFDNGPLNFGLDLVHYLHGFDDANSGCLGDFRADFCERFAFG